MFKYILVCLLWVCVLGCGTNRHAEDGLNFKKVSFSKMIKALNTYARPNALLAFEAVITSTSRDGEIVWLETDSERVQFWIVTDQSISKKNKISELRVDQKYIFRCKMHDVGTFRMPTDQIGMTIIVEFLTDKNGEVRYPPVLID